MKPRLLALVIVSALLAACAGPSQRQSHGDGINVGEASSLRGLVPADKLEKAAASQYLELKQVAAEKNALAPDNNPQLIRLRAIEKRILPFVGRFNPEAPKWHWEVNLILSKELNAFCMPGGKIAFFSGVINELKLDDNEIAIIMGHEIAHALREHAREHLAKSQLTSIGSSLLGQLLGGGELSGLFKAGGNLMSLKFSRDDENEADLIGLDLAARAGYDPRAGISLWQKMEKASKGAPPAWLSTHPANQDRVAEINQHLPEVIPLYEATQRKK